MAWNNSYKRAIPANSESKWNEQKFQWLRSAFDTGNWQCCIAYLVGFLNFDV
jgi:hypothetical protein